METKFEKEVYYNSEKILLSFCKEEEKDYRIFVDGIPSTEFVKEELFSRFDWKTEKGEEWIKRVFSHLCVCGCEMTRKNTMNMNREEGESRGSWSPLRCTSRQKGIHFLDRNCVYALLSELSVQKKMESKTSAALQKSQKMTDKYFHILCEYSELKDKLSRNKIKPDELKIK